MGTKASSYGLPMVLRNPTILNRETVIPKLFVTKLYFREFSHFPTDCLNATIFCLFCCSLSAPFEDTKLTILVSAPSTYPATSPPQLQLLSRYIGPFGVDATLFGSILRTFISSEAIEWTPDSVCVFDGLEWVKERCTEWFEQRKNEKAVGELLREDERGAAHIDVEEGKGKKVAELVHDEPADPQLSVVSMPEGIEITEAEPITDRRSSFVGRACRITHPSQVGDLVECINPPLIVQHRFPLYWLIYCPIDALQEPHIQSSTPGDVK